MRPEPRAGVRSEPRAGVRPEPGRVEAGAGSG